MARCTRPESGENSRTKLQNVLVGSTAQNHDSATIDLRHLLIALLVEETGKAGQVLKEFGVTPLDARNGLLGPAH